MVCGPFWKFWSRGRGMGRGEIGAIVREHASVSPEVGRRSRSPPYSPRSNWPVRALTSSDNLSARPDFARTRFFCERGDRIVQRQSRRSVARTLYTFSVVDISAAGAACAAPPVKGKNWGQRGAIGAANSGPLRSGRSAALVSLPLPSAARVRGRQQL